MHSSLPASSTGSVWPFSPCSSPRWVSICPLLNTKTVSLTADAATCPLMLDCAVCGASEVHRQILIIILTAAWNAPCPVRTCHSLIRFWLVELTSGMDTLKVYCEITQQRSTSVLWNKTCLSGVVKAGTVAPPQVSPLISRTNTLKCRWSFSVLLVLNNCKASGVLYWFPFSLQRATFILVSYTWPPHC